MQTLTGMTGKMLVAGGNEYADFKYKSFPPESGTGLYNSQQKTVCDNGKSEM